MNQLKNNINPLKISIIGSRGYPYVYSGYETLIKELSERLVARGCEVTVYCHRNLFNKKPVLVKGIKLVYVPTIESKSRSQLIHSFLSMCHAATSNADVIFAVNAANGPFGLISKIFRLMGRGSSISGFIDGKLNINILKSVDYQDKPVIFVLGTNGKTTTSNILHEIISKENKVVANLKGANLESGIKTSLINSLKFDKTIDADYILLEVDEKTLKGIKEYVKPTHILITNFFRDQLDRYGEIDMIINEIIESINELDAKVFLNGNDPLQVFRFEKCTSHIEYYL